MAEKIKSIEEQTFKLDSKDYTTFEGFLVVTNKQTIKVGIDSGQSCCEDYGYFMTNDEIDEFIGASLLSIDVVDDCLNKEKLKDLSFDYGGGVMFVNFETDKGTLQFTAYNEHNGYYGHEAVIISNQLTNKEGL